MSLLRASSGLTPVACRLASFSTSAAAKAPSAKPPRALSVFLSQSHNVFTNMALEDWLYRNLTFGRHNVLLVWRNSPCVVIGRHQNPWREVDTEYLQQAALPLARRNSGGGAVYHDMGNLNLTFFSSRGQYDRAANLALVADALRDGWGFDISVTQRDDVLLDNAYKVSGTAAKLTRDKAYHHCTLMVNVDTHVLQKALAPPAMGLQCRATRSVPAPVRNLADGAPSVTMEKMVAAIGQRYLRQHGQQASRGFQMVNPTDDWFPGVSELEQALVDPAHVYGRTPAFQHTFRLPGCSDVEVCVHVQHGRVTSAQPLPPDNSAIVDGTEWVRSILPSAYPEKLAALVGTRYSANVPRRAEALLLGNGDSERDAAEAASRSSTDKRVLAL